MHMTDITRWPLKMAILKSEFSQARIAREMNRSESWLSRVVSGLIDPSIDEQVSIEQILQQQKLFFEEAQDV
jgi:hypothetical protein